MAVYSTLTSCPLQPQPDAHSNPPSTPPLTLSPPKPTPPPPPPFTQPTFRYFRCIAGFTDPEVVLEVKTKDGATPSPLAATGLAGLPLLGPLLKLMERSGGDPFYGVLAYRNFKREDA